MENKSNDELQLCHQLLCNFVNEASLLYGKSFVSYNVHSLTHLVDDYWHFGSLETVNAFVFESYLGILKKCIKSGYKPLQQVARHAFHRNHMSVYIDSCYDKDDSIPVVENLPCSENGCARLNVRNLVLPNNGGILKCPSLADCSISYEDHFYKVVSIFRSSEVNYLNVKAYLDVKNLFTSPIDSSVIGVYIVDNLSDDMVTIEVTSKVRKCMLLPRKRKYVALELLH